MKKKPPAASSAAARQRAVQQRQPTQQQPHQPLDHAAHRQGRGPRQQEVLDAPDQDAGRSGGHAAGFFMEVPEQPAMARARESGEVVLTHVHLLHEGCGGIHQPVFAQHTMNLVHAALGLQHVFEHRDADDQIELRILERQVGGVAHDLGAAGQRHIGLEPLAAGDQTERAVACSPIAAAHDQHAAALSRSGQQALRQLPLARGGRHIAAR